MSSACHSGHATHRSEPPICTSAGSTIPGHSSLPHMCLAPLFSHGFHAGVLTETTAELAAALTLSAARRVAEADVFMRGGQYRGWLPDLFVGLLLQNKTVGIIGAGRIGAAYARMMVEGHKMDLVYYDPYPNKHLEQYVTDYGAFLKQRGERPVSVRRVDTVNEVLRQADVRRFCVEVCWFCYVLTGVMVCTAPSRYLFQCWDIEAVVCVPWRGMPIYVSHALGSQNTWLLCDSVVTAAGGELALQPG